VKQPHALQRRTASTSKQFAQICLHVTSNFFNRTWFSRSAACVDGHHMLTVMIFCLFVQSRLLLCVFDITLRVYRHEPYLIVVSHFYVVYRVCHTRMSAISAWYCSDGRCFRERILILYLFWACSRYPQEIWTFGAKSSTLCAPKCLVT